MGEGWGNVDPGKPLPRNIKIRIFEGPYKALRSDVCVRNLGEMAGVGESVVTEYER